MSKPHISKQHGAWWCILNLANYGMGKTPESAYKDYIASRDFKRMIRELQSSIKGR